ncbi:MAG: hypothetical protein EB150_07275 [Nitrososphaeria archaeon]|nr:hypothetical protein [Nitrososphaeria archaeon]NDB51023.1 hypothetical protein [Nitrosopumilaceae archaeon]NDB87974.1 hypothetical protein [Nitrososphaerota archaeon]NDB46622.1 hypothetical protein [Nitrososphaeria archaeon]NDB63385.1 hypothetical protein [Nitrosopumilaceae archaeon]
MSLEDLRTRAIYQNSMDTWIAACEEKKVDWYETEHYKKFIAHLLKNGLALKKFPLCVKETGGFEGGKNKTTFAETLANQTDPNAAVYTIKLNDTAIKVIRDFSASA